MPAQALLPAHSDLLRRYGGVAVITGASDGIGKAFAEELARAGFAVVLVARRQDTLDALAADLSRRHGIKADAVALDLATDGSTDALLAHTRDMDVGLLVAAAGFGTSGPFLTLDPAVELGMIDLNCRSVTELAHGYAHRFKARKRGGIVLFGSIVGWQGAPYASTYGATKAFVQALAEGLAVELAPDGIDVLSCAPGPVASGFADRARMRMGKAERTETVARHSLAALGRRNLVVPGLQGKFLTWSLAMLPRAIRVRVLGSIMKGMAPKPGA